MQNRLSSSGSIIVCEQEREVRWETAMLPELSITPGILTGLLMGVIALLKQIALPYQQFFHEQGITVVAVEASCRYRRNLKPEERYILRTTLSYLGRTRMIFDYLIIKPEEATGKRPGEELCMRLLTARESPSILKKRPDLWEKLLKHTGLPE